MTNKITCLEDAINHVPRVRVIKDGDENYGKEFDIGCQNHNTQMITIFDGDDKYFYHYSKIQFLTPVQYEGRYIGLGDKVNGKEVFDYGWHRSSWFIDSTIDYTETYGINNITNIYSFEPLHQLTPKIELSTEELLEELKRRGVVTSGNIIKS